MQPLAGLTVLDLGQIYNGPYATFLMAMSGARVIKVESLVGETLRSRGTRTSATYAFALLNQGKESISLNLKSERGVELFRRLVEKADVVLENFGPDTMDSFGLSAAKLLEINPRLIYAAGSGYGRAGAHRDYLAMDITVQAMAGVMSTTGVDELPPLKAGPAISDFFGGTHLYGAVVTALLERERSGKGAIIDVAMQDTVFPTLSTIIGSYYYHDRALPARNGNKHPGLTMAPYNVYEARDGHVAIICVRDGHWRGLLRAMGREDLLEAPEYAAMLDRAARMDEVDQLVNDWTKVRSKSDILERLQAEEVPTSIVRNIEEVMADAHLHDRGFLRDVEHPVLGEITLSHSPISVAFGHTDPPSLAPELGQHNEAVYGGLLGLNEEELANLRDEGVI